MGLGSGGPLVTGTTKRGWMSPALPSLPSSMGRRGEGGM